jgi:hypothetical protein
MSEASSDVWEVMSTARTIRRVSTRPVDDSTMNPCLEAATWAPSGANARAAEFVSVLFTQKRFPTRRNESAPVSSVSPMNAVSAGRPVETAVLADLAQRARQHLVATPLLDAVLVVLGLQAKRLTAAT